MNTFLALLSGAACTFALLIVIGLLRIAKKKEPAPPAIPPPVEEKKHPCAVMHLFEVIQVRQVQLPACVHSIVLYRCSVCGIHNSVTHPGAFELGDFTRKKSEVEEIRGMFH